MNTILTIDIYRTVMAFKSFESVFDALNDQDISLIKFYTL